MWVMLVKKAQGFLDGFGIFWKKKSFSSNFFIQKFYVNLFFQM